MTLYETLEQTLYREKLYLKFKANLYFISIQPFSKLSAYERHICVHNQIMLTPPATHLCKEKNLRFAEAYSIFAKFQLQTQIVNIRQNRFYMSLFRAYIRIYNTSSSKCHFQRYEKCKTQVCYLKKVFIFFPDFVFLPVLFLPFSRY